MKVLRDPPPVAVLILNYNGMRFLPECLASVRENAYPATDVYLIDNASHDASVSWVRAHEPTVGIFQNTANLGFAPAYDHAVRFLVDYRYHVLLNNDTVVERDWLVQLVQAAELDDRVAACGSKILMMHDRSLIDHAGGLFTWIGSGLDMGKWTTDKEKDTKARETGFGCGASLLVRRSAYLDVGGFDTAYTMYHEDVDLCWRLRMAGYSVLHVPSSVVYHHGGGIDRQGIDLHPARTCFCQRNRLANIFKNMPAGRIPLAMAVSAVYDAVRIARLAALGRRNVVEAILRGYREAFASAGSMLRKRKDFLSRVNVAQERALPFLASIPSSASAYRCMLQAQRARGTAQRNQDGH
ncbi:MAG: glycosyltransferase family 2 protein [Deltaproteobacteria bacterium]|nr:glycosyltransferase family 2 protein [Deltaproteobacteria bacterium]